MFPRALIGLCLAAALLPAQSPDARLESAIHAEIVDGNVKAALDQYQKVLADTGTTRPTAARALLGIADCEQKLGQTTEAQAAYTKVIAQHSDQSAIAIEAKTKLDALVNAPAGPRNLNFENGLGENSAGWFVPKSLKEAGYSAEIQHQGCRQNPTCAVVIAPNPPKTNHFGNLTQSFNATAYRGKTVRLHAFLKMDSTNPDDGAQMWFRVDRPNRMTGAFDNMADRAVKSPNWTEAEIVEKVAGDALTINIGVMAILSGRAWVDGMTFEVVPDETPETSLISRKTPLNLDFQEGREGSVPAAWGAARTGGFSAELRRTGCRTENPCAVVIAASPAGQVHNGALAQGFKADNYRGKTLRLRAWLKLDKVDPSDTAQMWMSVHLKDQKAGFFDNMSDRPVISPDWQPVEIVGKVAEDAQTIDIGVMSVGKGTAWVDSMSFEVIPDGTPLTGAQANPPVAPRNLSFSQGTSGVVPAGWMANRTNGYSAELRHSGCAVRPTCAVVIGSPTPAPNTFGALTQGFNADAYRGKTVRLRAKLKLDAVDPTDKAQMWMRVDRPNHELGFFDNMDDRPVQTSTWTDVEIVGQIDPDAEKIFFGVLSIGKGQAWVDSLSFEVVPDGTPQTGKMSR